MKRWSVIVLAVVLIASGLSAQGKSRQKGKPVPPPDTTRIGERKLLAILVNWQDRQTEPYSAADVESMLFSSPASVNAFIQENSHGLTWVT